MTLLSLARAGVERLFRYNLTRFGLTAGTGFLLDFIVFMILVGLTKSALLSNIVSATVGVTFAYFASARFLIAATSDRLLSRYMVYVIYNATSILLFSAAISTTARLLGGHPVIAKVLLTPFSFYLNFLFINFLLTRTFRTR